MVGRSRFAVLMLGAVLVAACGGGRTTWAFPSGVEARPDPCKVAVTRLAGFTDRLAGDIVALRTLLVADQFDSAETARGIKDVSATLTAYPDLGQSVGSCDATAGLAPRAGTLQTNAATAVRPSLAAAPLSEGEAHWLAAYNLVELLPEILSLSGENRAAGEQLEIAVTAAVDPAGSNPPQIPLGPYVTATPDFQAFADRLVRRTAAFGDLIDEEMPNLVVGERGEVRRIGRRLITFADTEVKWLDKHEPEKCYRQFWRAVRAAWVDVKTSGNALVDGSAGDVVHSATQALNHLNTLQDRDYISEANAGCLTSPGEEQ